MDKVKPDENLLRYILQSNQIRTSDKTVKYTAFMPAPNGKTSVFRTSGLQQEHIWKIGDDVAVPRHANLTAWPDESSKQMAIALELTASSRLQLRN